MIAVYLLAILAWLGSAGCSQSQSTARGAEPIPAASAKASAIVLPSFRTETVSRGPLSGEVSAQAEFQPSQEVDVMAKVAGYLDKINVEVGDRVQEGQAIAELEVPELRDEMAKLVAAGERVKSELARAREEVTRSRTANDLAQLTYSRLAGVVKNRPGLVAQQEIDVARNRALITESQVSSAQASLAAAEQAVKMNDAEIGRARTMLAYTKVVAPLAGMITKRYVDRGALVQTGANSYTQAMPVVRISQTANMRLIVAVPESLVAAVREGVPVTVHVPSLNRSFASRFGRSNGRIDPGTRTLAARIDVRNPAGSLVPGMSAEVKWMAGSTGAVLSVPVHAVDDRNPKRTVMVLSPRKIVEIREVETGLRAGDRIEIRSGLHEGEAAIVDTDLSNLKPGMRIEPAPSN